MTLDETLAVLRMRQWSSDKDRSRRGTLTAYRPRGWTPYNQRQADARIVRMLDFEQAFSALPPGQQTLLLLTYRDGLSAAAAGRTMRQPIPTILYYLGNARRALARALDRRCLL